MQRFLHLLLKGSSAALPLLLTAYFLYWIGKSIELAAGAALRPLLPEGWYRPGAGIAVGVLLVAATGLLMELWVFRRIGEAVDRAIGRIPLIKSVYGSLRDMMRFFKGDGSGDLGQPVLVEVDGKRLIGFVTRHDAEEVLPGVGPDQVAVYLPMSYQLGGYLALVPADQLQPLELSVERALRLVLTAGIGERPVIEASPDGDSEAR